MIAASKTQLVVRKLLVYVALLVLTATLLFPFFWMISTSFKPATDIFSKAPTFIPRDITLEHYRVLWTETQFPVFFKNSTIIALSTTFLTLGVGTFFRIVLPLSAPGIAAVGAFVVILAWQEFTFALTLTNTNEMRTLPVGISMMVGFRKVLWGQLMAASVMITLPVTVLFVYFQKYFVSGMTMGSVKG